MADVTPSAEAVGRLLIARHDARYRDVSCARRGGQVPMERLAVLAGANVVAYPDPGTVKLAAEMGLQIEFVESCCTLVDARQK